MRKALVWLILFIGLALRLWIALTKPEVLWIDDSFYSLGIARNIAAGTGWTHDGIHVTNGFQPLYVFLMVPFYWLLPTQAYLVPVLALVLQSVLNVLTGLLLYRLLDHTLGWQGAFLSLVCWCLSPYIISGVNGLETPIQAFLIVLTSYHYVLHWRPVLLLGPSGRARNSAALALGAALGLLALTRIDSLIFAAAVLLDLCARMILGARHGKQRWSHAARSAALLGVSLLVIVLPWFLSSYFITGKVAFESGGANRLRSLAQYRGTNIYTYHISGLVPNLQVGAGTSFMPWLALIRRRYVALTLALLFGAGLAAVRLRCAREKAQECLLSLSFLLWFGIGLMGAYVFYQFSAWNWGRYFYGVGIAGIVLMAIWVQTVYQALVGALGPLRPRLADHAYTSLTLLFVLLMPISQPVGTNPVLTSSIDWYTASQYTAAEWLSTHTPPDVRVAAFQSGIIGYFSERTVINLDGVVNSEALPYYLDQNIARYLRLSDVKYLVDWRSFTETVDFTEGDLSADVVATFDDGNPVDVIRIARP